MTDPAGHGLVVAAPASGSGKTLVTVGLIAAYRARGRAVGAAKAGPDYIDAAFLAAAAGAPAINLDAWAMRPSTLERLARTACSACELLLVEGVMGLFDGAGGGAGSTGELARALGLPVVLVVDAHGQAQSAAALAQGFARFDPSVDLAGVILNRISGARHERLIREAFRPTGLPLFGAVPRDAAITLPSRHLGLVQAGETADLDAVIAAAGAIAADRIDLDALARAACAPRLGRQPARARCLPPPGQRIALARDAAFAFAYDHLIAGWRAQGADIHPFSPLADEAPDAHADAVWLPGGYPELHAGRLAANSRFLGGLRAAAARGATVYGECGGYMVLGHGLIDENGARHAMAGLLGLETSFAARRLALGYRRAVTAGELGFAEAGAALRGHEFHYATVIGETGQPAFRLSDSEGVDHGTAGLLEGRVAGSFLHVIDAE